MVDREIEALETLQHPNIIRLYEVIETVTNYYLILECVGGGTLDNKLKNAGKYTETGAATVFAQIASAIGHMVSWSFSVRHAVLRCELIQLKFVSPHDNR